MEIQLTKTKWHYCSECDERFKYRSNLDKHMRKEHHSKIYARKKEQKNVI